jgi:AraC-like DNA-binding protein
VAVLIDQRLAEKALTVAEAASLLGMPVRTLQRMLLAEGTTFSGLLDHARYRALKTALAKTGPMPPDQYRRIGYSCASVLRRAIQRWEAREQPTSEIEHVSGQK